MSTASSFSRIRAAAQEERNFRFHLCAACYALLASWLAELAAAEWCLIVLCIAAVLALELVNSAVERAVDKPDTTHWWSAGAAKDMAAGAVLVMAAGCLTVGLCLFLPRLPVLWQNLLQRPWLAVLCAVALLPAYLFIFRYHKSEQKGETPNGKNDP